MAIHCLRMRDVSSPLQVSKWLKLPILIDVDEMENLLDSLGDFWIFLVSGVTAKERGDLSKKEFLNSYASYILSLKNHTLSEDPRIRSYFSSVWTVSTDSLYAIPVGDDQQLIKVDKPVIQLQLHRFDYSPIDGKFRSMVFGKDSITWGIQFSYPQLYQDEQMQIIQVREGEGFPNTYLFKCLQKWVRVHTVATPFEVNHKRVNVPIRLGKNCFSWINNHPQLKDKGIKVITNVP